MRFAARSTARGVPDGAHLRVDGAEHEVRASASAATASSARRSSARTGRCSRTRACAAFSRCGRSDRWRRAGKPKLAVWKFASCDGCQLSLLDCEDELLALAGAVESPTSSRRRARSSRARTTSRWSRARSPRRTTPSGSTRCGALAAPRHDRRLRHRRRHPGAAQLPRREGVRGGRLRHARVHQHARRSTPIAAHVPVDFELRGCPINKRQLLEVISAFLNGRRPQRADPQRVRRVQAPRATSA